MLLFNCRSEDWPRSTRWKWFERKLSQCNSCFALFFLLYKKDV